MFQRVVLHGTAAYRRRVMRNRQLFAPLAALALLLPGCGQKLQTNAAESVDTTPITQVAPEKGADRSQAGKPAPDVEIFNGDDDKSSIPDATGKPMLVNLWASWCAPCVKELPTLEALSKRPGAPKVVIVSEDMAERPSVEAFLTDHKIGLESWRDPKMALSGALGAQIMPTTIYYGADGREIWRYTGDLDWAGDEASRLLAEGMPGASGR